MAKTKQFTITIENRSGAVAEIARTMGSAKVNILALLGTAQGTTGTVELVVEDARRARKALDEAKLTYKETTLAAKGVNLNSICATVSKGGKKAVVVTTVAASEKVASAA